LPSGDFSETEIDDVRYLHRAEQDRGELL